MQTRSLDCSWHMWAMLHQVLSISNPWLPLCPPLCLCDHPLSTKFLPQFHTTTRVPQQATLSILVLTLPFPAAARGFFFENKNEALEWNQEPWAVELHGPDPPCPPSGRWERSAASTCTKGGASRKNSLASRWQNPHLRGWMDSQPTGASLWRPH